MGISIRAYARHRGVSDTAVHKAIREGRITREADGSIDAARADRDWSKNSGTLVEPAPAKPAGKPRAEAQLVREAAAEPVTPTLSGGGTTLLQARTVHEALKVQIKKVELAQKKEELVDRAQAVAHVFSMARAERDAWLNWPARITPILAAELGIDEHTLFVAVDVAVRVHLEELGELRPRVN